MTERTREQHMADVAAATLKNLTALIDDAQTVSCQLQILANRLREGDPDFELPEMLQLVIGAPWILRGVREEVRDIAAKLPIRGLEYE